MIMSLFMACGLVAMFNTTQLDAMKANAVNLDLKLTVDATKLPVWGQFTPRYNTVLLNEELCVRPVEHQQYVMAHEIGHAVATKFYADHDEAIADMYASRLLTHSWRMRIQDYFDALCKTGDTYGCLHATRWEWARTQ